MKLSVPVLLSTNGGYVDTAGFLALQGLFSAHVTGNFVTLGAALANGTSGIVAKLLALPVFCLVVALVRVLGMVLPASGQVPVRVLLGIQLVLLSAAAAMALFWGPFPNGDASPALVTGMTLVAAMSVQNALQRIYLSSAPPTTLMTGNTTQIMIDLVDRIRGVADTPTVRLRRMGVAVLGFAIGCAVAAVLFTLVHMACFLIPPLVSLAALAVSGKDQAA
jgi:uncharacterized membrane protein YoaK (UPF0700 family)